MYFTRELQNAHDFTYHGISQDTKISGYGEIYEIWTQEASSENS